MCKLLQLPHKLDIKFLTLFSLGVSCRCLQIDNFLKPSVQSYSISVDHDPTIKWKVFDQWTVLFASGHAGG